MSELGTTKDKLETALRDLAETTTKLMVSSGVTSTGRNEELLNKLQRIHTGMQNNIENLEAEVAYLKKHVRFLERTIQQEGIVYDHEEWTDFEAPVKDANRMADEWAALTGGDGSQL